MILVQILIQKTMVFAIVTSFINSVDSCHYSPRLLCSSPSLISKTCSILENFSAKPQDCNLWSMLCASCVIARVAPSEYMFSADPILAGPPRWIHSETAWLWLESWFGMSSRTILAVVVVAAVPPRLDLCGRGQYLAKAVMKM